MEYENTSHISPINGTTLQHDTKEANQSAVVQEIRVLIDNHQVGGIIGKGGANVKRVREESGAFVSILKADFRNVSERIMVLKGTSAQIAVAAREIGKLMRAMVGFGASRLIDCAQKDKQEIAAAEEANTTIVLRFLVHRSAVGAIIGKLGVVIKETQAQTKTRVQVSNEPLPQSTEKTVSITGTPFALEQAAARILCQLRDNPVRSGTKVYPYVPGQPMFPQNAPSFALPYAGPHNPLAAHAHAHAGPLYGSQSSLASVPGLPPFGGQPQSTQKIAIPTICAGCVIGKRGTVIKSLREQSQTNISIADPEASTPNERVVTISGSPQGIQAAVFLIRQLVEQYQPTGSF